MIDSVPGPVSVFAYSYGALCALEAATLTTSIHRMVLYEPPVYSTVEIAYPPDILRRYDECLRAGDPEKALLLLYEAGHMPSDELDALRANPSWRARLSAASTIPREVIGVRSYALATESLSSLRVPTLLLIGGESIRCRISILPGQGHEAIITAPDVVLREVIRCLADDRRSGR